LVESRGWMTTDRLKKFLQDCIMQSQNWIARVWRDCYWLITPLPPRAVRTGELYYAENIVKITAER